MKTKTPKTKTHRIFIARRAVEKRSWVLVFKVLAFWVLAFGFWVFGRSFDVLVFVTTFVISFEGHKHGGRNPTETSVFEFCHKRVNSSLEELIKMKVIFILRQKHFRQQNIKKSFKFSTDMDESRALAFSATIPRDAKGSLYEKMMTRKRWPRIRH